MKKILTGILVIIILLLQCVNVEAVKLESIKMNIELPEEYYDLKAGVDSNDSKITYYETVLKTTKEELIQLYEQNSILYNGINTNLSKELIVSESQNWLTKKIFHLNTATDEQLEEVERELAELATEQNMQVLSQEVYKKDDIVFIFSYIQSNDLKIYQYYTMVNGKGITISLNCSYSNTQVDELRKIVDTISFDEIEEKTPDISSYIIIGISAILIIIVIVLMIMAFSKKESKK